MRTKKKLRIQETPNFFDKHNKRGNIIEINKNKNLKPFFYKMYEIQYLEEKKD
jgi:hypothetical protein